MKALVLVLALIPWSFVFVLALVALRWVSRRRSERARLKVEVAHDEFVGELARKC